MSRAFSTVSYDEIRSKRVRWADDKRIPLGYPTLLTGNEGDGKSMYTCHLAAQGSRGNLRGGDLYGQRVVTLFITGEDGPEEVIRPRLLAAGADMSLVRHVSYVDVDAGASQDMPVFPEDVGTLKSAILEYGASLVFIDPLASFLAERIDSWKDASLRLALDPLARVARETNSAIVVIVHPNKAGSSDPLMRISGARAFTQVCRSVLIVGRDPNDEDDSRRRFLTHMKCNIAAKQATLEYRIEPTLILAVDGEPELDTARMEEVGVSALTSRDMFSQPKPEERTATDDAVDMLRAKLAGGVRVPAADIEKAAADAKISKSALRRAKGELRIKPAQEGFHGGWYWSLPTDDPSTQPPVGGSSVASVDSGGHLCEAA